MVRKVNHDQVVKAAIELNSRKKPEHTKEFQHIDMRDAKYASKITSDPERRKYYAKLLGIKE